MWNSPQKSLLLVPIVVSIFFGLNLILLMILSSTSGIPTMEDDSLSYWLFFLGAFLVITTLALAWTIKQGRRKFEVISLASILSNIIWVTVMEAVICIILPLLYRPSGSLLQNFWYNIDPAGVALILPSGWMLIFMVIIYGICALGIELAAYTKRKALADIQKKVAASIEGWQVHALVGQFYRWTLVPLVVMLCAPLFIFAFSCNGLDIPLVLFFFAPLIFYQLWLQSMAEQKFQRTCFEMQPSAQKIAKDLEGDFAEWAGNKSQGDEQTPSKTISTEPRISWNGTSSQIQGGRTRVPVLALVPLIVGGFFCGNIASILVTANIYTQDDSFFYRQVGFAAGYLACIILAFCIIAWSKERKTDPFPPAQISSNILRIVLAEWVVLLTFPLAYGLNKSLVISLSYILAPGNLSPGLIALYAQYAIALLLGAIALILTSLTNWKIKETYQKQTPKALDAWETKALMVGTYHKTILPLLLSAFATIFLIGLNTNNLDVGCLIFSVPLLVFHGWLIRQSDQQFRRACTEMQPPVLGLSQSVSGLNRGFKDWKQGTKKEDTSKVSPTSAVLCCEFCGAEFANAKELRIHHRNAHPATQLGLLNPFRVVILFILGMTCISLAIMTSPNDLVILIFAAIYLAGFLCTFGWVVKFNRTRKESLSFKQIQSNIPPIIIATSVVYFTFPLNLTKWEVYYENVLHLEGAYYIYRAYWWGPLLALVLVGGVVAFIFNFISTRNARLMLVRGYPKTLDAWSIEILIGSVFRWSLIPPIFCTIVVEGYVLGFTFGIGGTFKFIFLFPLLIYHLWLRIQGKAAFRRTCFAMHPSAQAEAMGEFMADVDRESTIWKDDGKKKQEFPGEVLVTSIPPATLQGGVACKLCGKVLPSEGELWNHLLGSHKSLFRGNNG